MSPELELELDVELELDPADSSVARNAHAVSTWGLFSMMVQGFVATGSTPLTREMVEHCVMDIAPVAAHELTVRMASTQALVDWAEISPAVLATPWRH